jgi:hypothetical protein
LCSSRGILLDGVNNTHNNNNNINAGTNDMGAINSNDRIAATLYFLGTRFVSGVCV